MHKGLDCFGAARLAMTSRRASLRAEGEAIQGPRATDHCAGLSEIRLLRHRQVIVEDIRIVLGADLFIGLLLHAPIAPHSGPGLKVGVRVLDREDQREAADDPKRRQDRISESAIRAFHIWLGAPQAEASV